MRLKIYQMIQMAILEEFEHYVCLYSTYKYAKNYITVLKEDLGSPLSIFKKHIEEQEEDFMSRLWLKMRTWPMIGDYV